MSESEMTWYVELDVGVSRDLSEAELDDALEQLRGHAGSLSFGPGRLGVSMCLQGADPLAAAAEAQKVLAEALPAVVEVTHEVVVRDEQAQERAVQEPTIPDLVGYAEISEMAGVSRQRARLLADLPGFPVAVVTTKAGPLRTKAAVEAWLESWSRTPGRPRRRRGA